MYTMFNTYAGRFFIKLPLVFYVFSLTLLNVPVYPVSAKAPETAKIVLAATPNVNWDILLMNPDGTQQVNLTNHPALDYSPAWSPTGEQILFSSDRDRFPGSLDLYLMDPDGGNVRHVFGKSKYRTAAAWSPDGKQIAYSSREQGQSVLYIATIGSNKEERVGLGSGPVWSPDGTKIAFVSGAPEREQISILNLRSRKEKIFFPPNGEPSLMGSIPAWSPTGDRLAFSWLHRVPLEDFLETQTIYILNRDGTGLKQIVPEVGLRARAPVWSPDGNVLLYQQSIVNKALEKKQWQIFKITIAGGVPVEVGPSGWYGLGDWFDPAYALPVSPQPQFLTTTWGDVKKK